MKSQRFLVHVGHAAFTQIVLATIAAFDVPGQNKKGRPKVGHEAYGLLWGHETKKIGCTQYVVESTSIDIHANTSRNDVAPSSAYRAKMSEIVHAFWPTAHLIGEFHSHPYRKREDKPATMGLSEDDREVYEESGTRELKESGFRVFLVLSVELLKKNSWRRPAVGTENQLSWGMGKYGLILNAYIGRPTTHGLLLLPQHRSWPNYRESLSPQKRLVSLVVPSVMGLEDLSQVVGFN